MPISANENGIFMDFYPCSNNRKQKNELVFYFLFGEVFFFLTPYLLLSIDFALQSTG